MDKASEFAKKFLGISKPSKKEQATIALLLYPTLGPTGETGKAKKPQPCDPIIYRLLGEEGVAIFKRIFDNNSKKAVEDFYTHPLMRKIWIKILPHIDYKSCFGNGSPKQEIQKTYREITRIMTRELNVQMPKWWVDRFPSL